MRLLVLFLVCSIGLTYAADSYAQKALISIDVRNQRVEDILKEIEEQSDFDFFFNNKHVDLNRRVSVSADKSNIFSVLKEIFSGTNVKYSVLDKKIILSIEAQSPEQEKKITVSGTISDAQGEPIIGASVLEKGVQGNGTITDIDGNFKISVSSSKAQLDISYIGYQSQTVAVQPGKNMKIILQEDSKQLDEVVVVGYGTQSKKTLTGAVSMVNMGDVEMNTVPNVSRALAGKAAGFRVNQVSAQPGGEAKFRIRGEASTGAGNEPLFVIDGFPVSSTSNLSSGNGFYESGNIDNVLESLNPDDIESISVLKDAASTAIYGARAGHGVVLITTKRGKSQKPRVTYSGMGSVQVARSNYKMLDTRMYMDMYNKQMHEEWLKLNGMGIYEGYVEKQDTPPTQYKPTFNNDEILTASGTDWLDAVMRNGYTQQHNLSVNGGTEKAKYKLSFIHQDQPSVMVGNGLKQNNMNASFNFKPFKFLTLEYRTRLLHKEVDGSGTEGVSLLTALREKPTKGLDEYMKLPEDDTYFDPDQLEEETLFDPKEESKRNYKKRINKSLNTMGAVTWDIMKGMTFRSEFGFENNSEEQRRFWGMETSKARSNNNQPVAEWSMKQGTKWQLTNVWNYNFMLKDVHDIRLMLGQEIKHNQTTVKTYTSRFFPENITAEKVFDNLSLGTPYENSSSAASPSRISSFFGRINYGYNDKYLATVTLRADGSSKFAKGNRWGLFPAGALAWRISNEDFLKDNQVVSNLKLRLSYGTSGNDRIDADLYQKLYRVNSSRPAGWGEVSHYYYEFYNSKYVYNPDVKWETTITRNIGLDFGFFKERLSGTIDVYWNTVKDLLVPSDIPGYTGYTKLMTNVGQTSNRGIELQLNAWLVETKDFSLNATFNIGHNKNKIDKLASGEKEWILTSAWRNDVVNSDDYRAYVGGTSGLIYGYVNDGFYTVADFEPFDSKSRSWKLKEGVVDSSPLSDTPRPGNAKFKKLTPVDPNSTNPYQLTEADRTVIGNTTPKFSGGFGLNATYKGFDMSMFFNFMYDFDVLNANKIMLTTWADNKENNFLMNIASDKRWRNFDDMGNEIRYSPEVLAEFNKNATMWNPTSIGRPICMSYAVEDGSFLRLNSATLGYTLPSVWTKKVGLSKVRFYVSGNNLFTLTGYSGYDPEVNIATGLTPNIDYNRYPRSRTYTFGAQLTF